MGRSTHANAIGRSSARIHAGGVAQFLQLARSLEDEWRDRAGDARTLPARKPQQARFTRDGGAASVEGHYRQLSRRTSRADGCDQQSRRRERRNTEGAILACALHRARRLPRESSEAVLPPVSRTRGSSALRLLHHLYERGKG